MYDFNGNKEDVKWVGLKRIVVIVDVCMFDRRGRVQAWLMVAMSGLCRFAFCAF